MNETSVALFIGKVAPLGPKAVPSGIAKQPVTKPVRLTALGFVGDEQGDTVRHGGVDKAVHHYPADHYAVWREDVGDHPLLKQAGAFGENVAAAGLTEDDVAIGDRFRLGGALVEVSQGRQPCFRLNLRFDRREMAARMQRSGRTGWYYRVVEEGVVAPGDRLTLVDRPTPEWTIQRIWRVFYVDVLDREALDAIAALQTLPERWRELAAARLASGRVEDWKRRLEGD